MGMGPYLAIIVYKVERDFIVSDLAGLECCRHEAFVCEQGRGAFSMIQAV